MNIWHRINARKVSLCYIYRDLYYSTGAFQPNQENSQHHVSTPSIESQEDHEFMSSMGVRDAFQETIQDPDVNPWLYGLSEPQDDCAMIVDALRLEPLEIDREYVFQIIESYRKMIATTITKVAPHLTQFQRDELDTIKKALFVLWITEKKVIKSDPKVVINELVELAKRFWGQDVYKFINGIAHRVLL